MQASQVEGRVIKTRRLTQTCFYVQTYLFLSASFFTFKRKTNLFVFD
jgi:hypothetical protein